jgi:hypothetical protein
MARPARRAGPIVRPPRFRPEWADAAPGAGALAWVTSWLFAVNLALLTALLLLLPSGRPPSPRWRWVLWLASVGNGLVVIGALALSPRRGAALLQTDGSEPAGVLAELGNVGFWAALAALLAAGASLVVRFRRARGRGASAAQVAAVRGGDHHPRHAPPVPGAEPHPELAVDLASALLIALIPVAVGLAILRYRLYDIDRLINRTMVYGLLTVILGLGYATGSLVFVLVAGPGADPPSWLVAAATLAAAAIFRPARRHIQAAVDRRFNRRKYNSAQTIQAYSTRLRDQIDLDTLSTELLAVVDQTMEPTRVSVWLRPSPPGASGAAPSRAWPTT